MKNIKEFLNLNSHTETLAKYNVVAELQSLVEIDFNFSNGNWINLLYRKDAPEGSNVIYFDSNIDFYGYEPFKSVWKLDENIEDFLFSHAIPTLSLLNGSYAFAYGTTELEDAITKELVKNSITPSVEYKLFSFQYWNKTSGEKDNLEYNGTVIHFSYEHTNITLYIQKCQFIYVEFESKGEKNCFPCYYFKILQRQKKNILKNLSLRY